MSLDYIRRTYQVPAKRGAKVRYTPDTRDVPMEGTITGTHAALLRVRFPGHKRPWLLHPTWSVGYL